ncbi:MAG: GH3 auxin-responsive promoter family protein [Bacteroidota bacterium]
MKKWVNQLFKSYYEYRMHRIKRFMQHPDVTQERVLQELLTAAQHTEWGKQYDYRSIRTQAVYAARVPVSDYDGLKPYINRMMHGERDVLWNGQVRWFSKSSGTTNDKSKYIPVSRQNLHRCHIRGTWDTMTLFYDMRDDARQFECKSLVMGGSLAPFEPYPRSMRGDVSAIMIKHMPWVARSFFTPDFETALLSDFEEKIERIAHILAKEPELVMVGGVPTWTVVLFRRVLEITGKSHLLEVWPHLQGYIHGGVSFTPYRDQFKAFLPDPSITYQEIYNASEGYFAVQDSPDRDDMLLLLDNGVYYEFLPMSEWDKEFPKAVPLAEVETGCDYAMLISSNSGLWRYKIGDTVTFTSVRPYRIRITGRTKQFVNAFGEELMVENADRALARTCEEFGIRVVDYTVAPIYFEGDGKGGHQWLVEFDRIPNNLEAFADHLDLELQEVNSDYEAKRYKNMALHRLRLRALPVGTFHRWMRSRGKFGGQHKVPRLANHRQYVEEILRYLEEEPFSL